MASVFLGKYASITAVDLIQRKKLDFRNFYESNLTESRLVFLYHSIRIMTVLSNINKCFFCCYDLGTQDILLKVNYTQSVLI